MHVILLFPRVGLSLDTKMDDATPLEEEGLVMLALTTRGHQSEGLLCRPSL